MKHIKNFSEFVNDLENSKDDDNKISIEDIKKNIDANNLTNATIRHPLDHDIWIYRLTIISLALIILAVLGSTIYIVCNCENDCEIPSGLIAIGATAVGALAGLVSSSNRK